MEVARRLDLPAGKANELVNTVFATLEEAMRKGESVTITGFGKFDLVESKARTGHNPRTGQPVEIPAKTSIKFKPSKALKEMFNAPQNA